MGNDDAGPAGGPYRVSACPDAGSLRLEVRHERYKDVGDPPGILGMDIPDYRSYWRWTRGCRLETEKPAEFEPMTYAGWEAERRGWRMPCAHEFAAFCQAFGDGRFAFTPYAFTDDRPSPYMDGLLRCAFKYGRAGFRYGPPHYALFHERIDCGKGRFDAPQKAWLFSTSFPNRRLVTVRADPPPVRRRTFFGLF